jgi:hypothetical protein
MLQSSAITPSVPTAMKSLQLSAQRTSLMFAPQLNSLASSQPPLTFHKKADRLRVIFQQRRTFLGQKLQMKMAHLNQMLSLKISTKVLVLILEKTPLPTAALVSAQRSLGLCFTNYLELTM